MLRKIKTQEEIAKKKKQTQIIVGTAMIFLLVVSTLGFSLSSRISDDNTQEIEQNGFTFFQENGRWNTYIEGQNFNFVYLPEQIAEVSVEGFYDLTNYAQKPLYFVGTNQASSEILNTLGRYVSRNQEVCLEGEDCIGDLPIKTCEDNLIIFKESKDLESSTDKVYQENNCVFIIGDSLKSADAFLYKVLKIN